MAENEHELEKLNAKQGTVQVEQQQHRHHCRHQHYHHHRCRRHE